MKGFKANQFKDYWAEYLAMVLPSIYVFSESYYVGSPRHIFNYMLVE